MARILVVDDAAYMRLMLKKIIIDAGHEVVGEAGNGEEAVTKFKELSPDLTTLDITMPVQDGLDALKEIMEIDPTARVIMCSAYGQQPKVVECMKAGALDFVVKPFQQATVFDAITNALKKK